MYKTVYLYVLDTMADWEAGYVIAELHSGRYFRRRWLCFALSGNS